MDFDALVEAQTGLGTAALIVMNKQVMEPAVKEALRISALRACVYIYIRQLSSFRVPTLWFIELLASSLRNKAPNSY